MHKITSLELLRTPETDFHEFKLFCRKSHFRPYAQKHFIRASKNTNSVFSATKQIMRM